MVWNTVTHVAFIIMVKKELSFLKIPEELSLIGITGDDELLLAIQFLVTLCWTFIQMVQGHSISAGKIHIGALQYLTRLVECDSHPGVVSTKRPLGPFISSFVTAKAQDVAFDLVAAGHGTRIDHERDQRQQGNI